jgi:hypothetical protein
MGREARDDRQGRMPPATGESRRTKGVPPVIPKRSAFRETLAYGWNQRWFIRKRDSTGRIDSPAALSDALFDRSAFVADDGARSARTDMRQTETTCHTAGRSR